MLTLTQYAPSNKLKYKCHAIPSRTSIDLPLSSTDLVSTHNIDYAVVAAPDNVKVNHHEETLKKRGYIQGKKLCSTLQGEMFEGKETKTNKDIVIKISNKKLSDGRISIQNNMNILVEENILKEAIILHHLTVKNEPLQGYISQFIDFFESKTSYYLIMEKAGNINLAEFSKKAHQYIREGKITVKQWKKVVKFIFFQLVSIVNWLHNDMHCTHLDLNLSNIVVENGNFLINNNKIKVDPTLKIKIVDFGVCEIFKPDNIDFKCMKYGITDTYCLTAPQVFNEDIYDARKADVWSVGIILYQLATGMEPYKMPHGTDKDYLKLCNSEFVDLVNKYSKNKHVSVQMVDVMTITLKINENERCFIGDVLKHQWLSKYYTKYSKSLKKTSISQRKRNKELAKQMSQFPYYEGI